jgi:acyl carrier protein phosphodiesterase
MNYLAHAFLSFQDPQVLLGNMTSDFIKGAKQYHYPKSVQAGITLHRTIDTFTDQHPATLEAKAFFRPAYRLYSGAFIDVVYDHFLATDPLHFSEVSLYQFSQQVYKDVSEQEHLLPAPFARMFPYMKEQNWLYNYRFPWGIEKSFGGLQRRAQHITEINSAIRIFEENYESLRECYHVFMPDMHGFAQIKFNELTE